MPKAIGANIKWLLPCLILLGLLMQSLLTAGVQASGVQASDIQIPALSEATRSDVSTASGFRRVDVSRVASMKLGLQLHYYRPAEPDFTVADAFRLTENANHWHTFVDERGSLGISQPPHWFATRFTNTAVDSEVRLLELGVPLIDRLDVFVVSLDGQVLDAYQTGDMLPFDERRVHHRNFLYPLTLAPQQDVWFFVRVQNGGVMEFPLHLWSEREFMQAEQDTLYLQGMFYGIMLIMVLYNLFIFVSTGDRSYLFFIANVSFSTIYVASAEGVGFQYLWSGWIWWQQHNVSLILVSEYIAICYFTLLFLNLSEEHPPLAKFLRGSVKVALVLLVYFIFASRQQALWLGMAIMTLGCVNIIVSGGLSWWRGNRLARIYTLAWSCMAVFAVLTITYKIGWVPGSWMTEHGVRIGLSLEVLLLSMALAERINLNEQARYEVQEQMVTEMAERNRAESELRFQSLHDPLTHLPNRISAKQFFDQLTASGQLGAGGLICIHLHSFKEVNNSLGRLNANQMLMQVACRLQEYSEHSSHVLLLEEVDDKKNYVVCLDGINYLIFVTGYQQEVESVARAVLRVLRRPFEFQDMSLPIYARLGIALFPDHGSDFETLIRNADVAVDSALVNPKHWDVYSTDIDLYSSRRLSLMGELRSAIENDRLNLVFQPQYDLAGTRVVGLEALLRWKHDRLGFISPDEFIPVAEKSGLIRSVTYWVLQRSLDVLDQLLAMDLDITMSVNLSSRNLQEEDFCQRLAQLLAEHQAPPNRLVLELTETAMMADPRHAQHILEQLTQLGVSIAIDDFGTGYSSLAYIKRLPLAEIKIDRSFVMDMLRDKSDSVIVKTTVSMSHNLGLKVVAEGVEDRDTLEALAEFGCDVIQGYYICKPLELSALIQWLAAFDEGREVGGGEVTARGV